VIITVTLNPSLDRTLPIITLVRGGVLRTGRPILEPGGKGVNVSRALRANGIDSVALVPIAGAEGDELRRLLDATGVRARYVSTTGRTRSNISLTEPDGTVTKLNEPGAPLTTEDLVELENALTALVSLDDWVVFSGSLPPAMAGDVFSSLLQRLGARGVRLAIDSSGIALSASVAACPDLIKPNRGELAELVGHPLNSIAEVIIAAEQIRVSGVGAVLVSLGADGAVFVGATGIDGAIIGESTVLSPVSAVGAGDCFLAGFLSRFSIDEADVDNAVLEALAWGAAAVALPGTAMPKSSDIDYTNVRLAGDAQLDRPLLAN
jgi:1-phosphofructokinase